MFIQNHSEKMYYVGTILYKKHSNKHYNSPGEIVPEIQSL